MNDDDIELIHSPLERTHSADGHTLRIHIYRSPESHWTLEVEDELGTSTVWDESFDTDTAALQAALAALEIEGVHDFVTSAQQAAEQDEPALLQKLVQARAQSPLPPSGVHDMMLPLSNEELDDLDGFLLGLDAEESMTLDMLDGFMHALAIGPQTVMPSRWLPKVWGQAEGPLPPAESLDEANHWLGLLMRHFNSIVAGYERNPPIIEPCWSSTRYGDDGELDDAETWAHGFIQAVELSRAAWQELLDDPGGQRWYQPIGLLGEDDFSADQDELTRTPAQRAALAGQIEDSLAHIHAFWLPLRQAVAEREQAQRMGRKVGRNEPCPCGSGNKFKKCCGAAANLH